jgi:hypothetical protein
VEALTRLQAKKAVLEKINDAYKLQIPNFEPTHLPIIAANIEQRANKLRTENSKRNEAL